MTLNLFSIFDPCNFFFNVGWGLGVFGVFILVFSFFSKFMFFFKDLYLVIFNEFKISAKSLLGVSFFIFLFIIILMINLISMVPSSFMITSQIPGVLSLIFPLWLSFNFYFLFNKSFSFFSHLVPLGSPSLLMPFMVLIELVSNFIRPITLTVRLIANIVAGHLLMHLLSSFSCSLFGSFVFYFLPLVMVILLVLEIAVGFIQSYILCTLLSLYSSEI